ncbi:MAG: ParB/RepB/Spo0J family partition protein, partial [Acinetobacter sp.]|nr:ParB/RepB/Spo0J family partition protein [Acinetobacter sp.]
MSIKKRGLAQGRGLSNLLGEVQKEKLHLAKTVDAHGEFTQLAIHQLQRGIYQPRGQILDDDVRELADSIKQHGIMQPLVVRRIDGANAQTPAYEIIAGERRWRAAKLAELSHVPVIIRDLDNQVAIALALIENIQRQDLNPIEQALALQRFHDEFNMSHQEIA